jgi:hypothetical protein
MGSSNWGPVYLALIPLALTIVVLLIEAHQRARDRDDSDSHRAGG